MICRYNFKSLKDTCIGVAVRSSSTKFTTIEKKKKREVWTL